MSQLPPPPDDPDAFDALLGRAAHLSQWLITQITGFLAPAPGKVLSLAFLRALARHYLLPAEAVVRRAVHLIAAALPPLATPQAGCRAGARPSQGNRGAISVPSKPLFRLTEPLPRPRTPYLPVSQRPRISVPGLTPLNVEKPASAHDKIAALEARLRRRLAALSAAWDNPRRAALRLQRLQARGALRTPALSFIKIPGARADSLKDAGAPILSALNAAAFDVSVRSRLAPPADTS